MPQIHNNESKTINAGSQETSTILIILPCVVSLSTASEEQSIYIRSLAKQTHEITPMIILDKDII